MALPAPRDSEMTRPPGPNQQFKDELDRLIDERLLPDERRPAASTEPAPN